MALVALSLWVFPPPAEYIVGGKDPGVYMNAGVQIAQRGSLVIDDELVASLPAETRGLFFPRHHGLPYYSNRFMGFFLLDPDQGTVIDQFPHLYPTAIAIGYDLAGLTGARYASTVCAVIGVLALYFLGARLIGKPAGAAAAGLLAIHLVQVWHARIPNSEVLAQALLLSGLLALARAHQDDDASSRRSRACCLACCRLRASTACWLSAWPRGDSASTGASGAAFAERLSRP